MIRPVWPIPVEPDIDALIRESAWISGLKFADVMRQGLRHGVPAFMDRIRVIAEKRPPACLEYLDDYPEAATRAKGYKAALRPKPAHKHDRSNR